MLTSTPKKRGRPFGRHRMRDGTEIQGLVRRKDGRWKVSATGQTFVEPDENLALIRFHEITEKGRGSHLGQVKIHRNAEDALVDMLERTLDAGGSLDADVTPVPGENGNEGWAVSDETLSPKQWAWLRKQLLTNRKFVAERAGIEQIAWLPNLERPAPSPTLESIGEEYFTRAELCDKERANSRAFWKDFIKTTGMMTVSDITAERCAAYADTVRGRGKSDTYVKHRFGKIKAILNFALKRGKAQAEIRRALDACAVLTAPKGKVFDPTPIDRRHFHKLLKAGDEQMKAILLVALNACMYAKECADLRWRDLDLKRGHLVAVRNKTKVSRIAILWPRTITALKKLPRRHGDDHVFSTVSGRWHNGDTLRWAFRQLKESDAVKLPEVEFNHIRDGSYTVAAEAQNTTLDQVRMLAGHRCGVSDHYLRRRPDLVANACRETERYYFG